MRRWSTMGFWIGAALAGSIAPAWAQASLDRAFSSLCTEPDDGGIGGYRIKLTGPEAASAVTFEEPEGALLAPLTATDVVFTPTNGTLTFVVPAETGRLVFSGTIGAAGLDGTLKRADGDSEPVHLMADKGGDGETPCPAPSDPAKP